MDIKEKRLVKDAQGSAAAEDGGDYVSRAGSMQYGANASYEAIETEKAENDLRAGVPHADNLPNPAASNADGNALLPAPGNFSSNPGFSSTGDMIARSAPPAPKTASMGDVKIRPNPTIGRSAVSRPSSVANPAPGSTDPGMDGSPLTRTSGYGG